MKQRGLDEEQAYNMLRNMAMQRNMKIKDVANELMNAAKLLLV